MSTQLKDIERVTFSIREISKMLGTSYAFLRMEIIRGNLKAVKRGRRVFILKTEFERYAGLTSDAVLS